MPSASSLSLGQSDFALVPDSDGLGTPNVQGPFNGGSSTSFLVNNAVVGSPIENLTLNTDLSPPTSSTNVSFGSAVSGLDANLGDGADTIAFNSAVVDSTIFTDLTPTSGAGGGDRFVANGGVFGTTINTGAGNDTLLSPRSSSIQPLPLVRAMIKSPSILALLFLTLPSHWGTATTY